MCNFRIRICKIKCGWACFHGILLNHSQHSVCQIRSWVMLLTHELQEANVLLENLIVIHVIKTFCVCLFYDLFVRW
jgi:hypothetical protein